MIHYLWDHLSKAYDSVGIIISWDNDGHLTTKSNLSTTLWMLQSDVEILLLFRDVIIDDVHCDLQLTVTGCKVQLPKAACQE